MKNRFFAGLLILSISVMALSVTLTRTYRADATWRVGVDHVVGVLDSWDDVILERAKEQNDLTKRQWDARQGVLDTLWADVDATGPAVGNEYWTTVDYDVTGRFASFRGYGAVLVGFSHPVARDSFEARLARNPELYRLFDLPTYAETVAAREVQ